MSRSLGLRGLLLFLLLAPVAACEKADSPPPGPPAPNMSGAMPRRLAYCPSAVPGAVTGTTSTADGIDVTITAEDPVAARAVVALAEFHARFPRSLFPFPGHHGLRSGGSRVGYCPIVYDGTAITTTSVPDGVRIHLRARSKERVRELQTLIKARAARFSGYQS